MDELRRRAEKLITETDVSLDSNISLEEAYKSLHNLKVHQIELEIQNEELRRVQVELEVSRAQYFDLYNIAPVGYATTTDNGLILEANLTLATMLGIDRSCLINNNINRYIFKADQDKYYLEHKLHLETGTTHDCDIRMLRNDGIVTWNSLRSSIVTDIKGVRTCRVIISDITTRKVAELDLMNSEEKFRMLTSLIPVGIYLADTEGCVSFANRKWREMAGLSMENALGNDWSKGLHPDDRALVLNSWQKMVTADGKWNSIYRLRTPEGKITWVHGIAVEMLNDSGDPIGYIVANTDITECKLAEELRDEIERITQHDLRSPAGAAINAVKLLANSDNLNDDDRELLRYLKQSGQNMLDILDQSINTFNIATNRYQYCPADVDIPALISETTESLLFLPYLRNRGINIYVDEKLFSAKPFHTCNIPGDFRLLRLAFQNIIQNALEASAPGQNVTINLTCKDQFKIEFRNNGVVPKEIRGNFFDKYITSGKTTGTGLGTYSAKMMIEAQGGRIEMRTSDKENETIVSIHMPTEV